jgi:hypothetical protein
MIAVKALDAVTVGRAETVEAAVLVGMIEVETPVIRRLVPIPMIVADVRHAVDAAAVAAIDLGCGARFAPGWRLWRATLTAAVYLSCGG